MTDLEISEVYFAEYRPDGEGLSYFEVVREIGKARGMSEAQIKEAYAKEMRGR